jgi:LPXTG-motif cell wall-anchored protein
MQTAPHSKARRFAGAAIAAAAIAFTIPALTAPAGATDHPTQCFKHEGGDLTNAHGSVLTDSNGVTYVKLNPYNQAWFGDHWHSLRVKGGTGSLTYDHPSAGIAYYAPINPANGKPFDVSHWEVCKGETPVTTTTTTTVAPTTTEVTTSTSSSTTTVSTTSSTTSTTQPGSTTSSTTTVPTSSSSSSTTTQPAETPTTAAPDPTTPPTTDIGKPPTPNPTLPIVNIGPPPASNVVDVIVAPNPPVVTPAPAPVDPVLPETGAKANLAIAATIVLALGLVLVGIRRRWSQP